MQKDIILAEVRRTASQNGGVALGRLRLAADAGVKEHHWRKYWARYNDLIREAGFEPNKATEGWTEEELAGFIAALAKRLGRFPTNADVRIVKSTDPDFPTSTVFERRLGNKAEKVAKVAAYCRSKAGYEDVLAMCLESTTDNDAGSAEPSRNGANDGFVYLIKSGRFYKIGRSVHAGARERQLAIQLPEPVTTVHVIKTDDPTGIEAYWHQRFAKQRKNGEWFELGRDDVAAFRRRKFM